MQKDKSVLLSTVIGIGMIGLIITVLFLVYRYSFLTVPISYLLPVAAGLCYHNKLQTSTALKKNIFATAVFGGVICIVIFFSQQDKIVAEIKNLFFDGHITKTEVLVESDGETAEHYENSYKFILTEEVSLETLSLLKYFLLLGIGGGLLLSFYFYAKSNPLKDDEFEDKGIHLIVVRIILAITLILCLLEMPYWYYNTIRWVVPMGCVFLAQGEFLQNRFLGYLFFVAISILFNPIDKIESNRLVWNIIDICLAIILFVWAVKGYIDRKSEKGKI